MTAKRIAIIQLPVTAIDALAAADLPAACRLSGLELTDFFVDADNLGTWRIRSAQLVDDPAAAAWITGVVWDVDEEPCGRPGRFPRTAGRGRHGRGRLLDRSGPAAPRLRPGHAGLPARSGRPGTRRPHRTGQHRS